MAMQPGEQPYSTSDAILAITLLLSGCEPVDEQQPCTNLFDPEILANLGYKGDKLGEAAERAWNDGKKGHVQFHIKLTERCSFLIQAHRDQMQKIEAGKGAAYAMLSEIMGDRATMAMGGDEAIMRMACVILKTRGQFVNLWKEMVPLLRIPNTGKSKTFDTTATNQGKTVEAKGVQRPGFRVISLNISNEHKKEIGL